MAPVWLALAARRAAASAARRAPPLLLDSTAYSAARRAPLQPAPPVLDAAASDLLAGKAKKPLALLDAADTHLLGRAQGLAGTPKQPPPLLDAAASSNVVKAIAAPTRAVLGADVRQAGISKLAHALSPKTGGFLFDLYSPRRASTGILFSAPNCCRVVARRGMSSEASLTPEVKAALQRMEEASLTRHQEAAEAFAAFRSSARKAYAMHEVNKGNNTVVHARVGWRIVWGTLALGTVGLYYTLHIKSLWFVQFKLRVLFLLSDMIYDLIGELDQSLKEIVGEELAQQSVMGEILKDSQLMAELSDPKVLRALQDVMRNPANIAKYQSNPKVGPVIAKVMAKLSGESCDQSSDHS